MKQTAGTTEMVQPVVDDGQSSLLSVRELKISTVGRPPLTIVDSVSLRLGDTESLGVVGESGSGKTMLCRALIGTLSRHGARVAGGSIELMGQPLANAPERTWTTLRGRVVAYVPQSSLVGLNPVLTIEAQLLDALRVYERGTPKAERAKARELLDMVRIPRPDQILRSYPAHLSGGMRQRVVIATAIAQRPRLLIADEPTTALDVSVEREILLLIDQLRRELGMALLLVSHDLGVVERTCDAMLVMYAGAAIEQGPVRSVRKRPAHPYTRGLLASRLIGVSPGDDIETIPGDAVAVGRWPRGCRFWPRCSMAVDPCTSGEQPSLVQVTPGRLSACLRSDELVGN